MNIIKKIFNKNDKDKDDKNNKNNGSQINILKSNCSNININRNVLLRTNTIDNFYLNDPLTYINNKYKIINKISQTQTKGVYLVLYNQNKYILKINTNLDDKETYFQIINYLKSHSSPYIKNIYDIIIKEHVYYIVYPYINGISLYKYIINNDYSEANILYIIKNIILGVKYLHDNNIIHCDIKPENIIIDPNNLDIKIIDLELSRFCETEILLSEIIGTLNYMAPESHDIQIYSKKSDVWSIGIILYMMLTHKNPIYDNNNMSRYNVYKHIDFEPINSIDNDILKKIVINSLGFDYKLRYNIDQLLELFKS